MKIIRPHLALAISVTLAACDSGGSAAPVLQGSVRVVNGAATGGAIRVLIDGSPSVASLAVGTVSTWVPVALGAHNIRVEPVSNAAAGLTRTLSFAVDSGRTLIAIDSASVVNPIVLTDTGVVAPAGFSKLRVVHFATQAPDVDVWRTQPDFQTLITIMFPFPYRAASPYLQSTPGDWTVVVTPQGQTDTLLATGAIAVADGQSRTVVLLDQPGGGLQFVVLTDR